MFENLLRPGPVFTARLTSMIRQVVDALPEYQAEHKSSRSGSYSLSIRDLEDGQLYRVTVEPEISAISREEREQIKIDNLMRSGK